MKRIVSIAIVLLLAATGAQADTGRLGLSAKVGTLGLGADATIGITKSFNLRLSGNWLSLGVDDFEFELDELTGAIPNTEGIPEIEGTADLALDLLTAGAFIDWHPGGIGLRASLGAFYNANQLSLGVKGDVPVDIAGFDVPEVDVDAVITFNPVAPYVGVGWGNVAKPNSHWHFALDLGLLGQGRPHVDLKATTGNPDVDAVLNTGLEQAIPLVEKRLLTLMIVPVAAIGASYTF